MFRAEVERQRLKTPRFPTRRCEAESPADRPPSRPPSKHYPHEATIRPARWSSSTWTAPLVDSVPDLARSVDLMMAELGRRARGEAAVRNWVGNGVERLVKRALTGTLDGEPDAGRLRPGLPDLRRALCGAQRRALAALSRRASRGSTRWPHAASARLRHQQGGTLHGAAARGLGVAERFEIIISGDTCRRRSRARCRCCTRRSTSGSPRRCADGGRLRQRREGGPGRRLCGRLRQLRVQSRPRHPRGGAGCGHRLPRRAGWIASRAA
jgi:hypothetical protein